MKQAFSTIRRKHKAALLRYIFNVMAFDSEDKQENTRDGLIQHTLNLSSHDLVEIEMQPAMLLNKEPK